MLILQDLLSIHFYPGSLTHANLMTEIIAL